MKTTRKGPKLPFTPAFQTKTLQLCLEDPTWLPHLKSTYFDDPLEGQVLEVMQQLHPKAALDRKTLLDACIRKLGRPAARRVLLPILKPLTEPQRAYLAHDLPRFTRFQQIGDGLVQGADLYEKHDVDGLIELFETAATPAPGSQITMKRASDIGSKRVDWLWKRRFARGVVHLVGGDYGDGKTHALCDFAACVTTGRDWPGGVPGSGKPGVVAFMTAEEAADIAINPRLKAAGADLSKVEIHDISQASGLSLDDDLDALERTLKAKQAEVLIVDSLNHYLPRINTRSTNVMADVLQRLARMAYRLNLVVILISHFNKNQEASARYRILDSQAIANTVRGIFYIIPDPKNDDGRLFVNQKPICGPRARPLGFRIVGESIAYDDGTKGKVGRLKWYSLNGRDINVDALLRPSPQRPSRPNTIAEKIIRAQLKPGKPVLSKPLIATVVAAGVSKETFHRARKKLGMRSAQRSRHWYCLPLGWTQTQIDAWKNGAKHKEAK